MKDALKKLTMLILIIASGFPLLADSGQDIVEKADAIFKHNRMYQKSTMTIVRNGRAQPVQQMESYYLEEDDIDHSLTLFLAPRRVKGTAYLSIGDDLWVRFASTGRIRKMSSSAKKNSAGGSDFSYSDMGEGNSGFAEKYNVSLSGQEKVRGIDCYKIMMIPGSDADDLYEKAVAYIAVSDFSYRMIELYEDGAHIKTMTFDDFKPVNGTPYPYTITMESLARNSISTVETLELEVDSPKVEDRFFSRSYLEAIR
jgi:hypothetical protein